MINMDRDKEYVIAQALNGTIDGESQPLYIDTESSSKVKIMTEKDIQDEFLRILQLELEVAESADIVDTVSRITETYRTLYDIGETVTEDGS